MNSASLAHAFWGSANEGGISLKIIKYRNFAHLPESFAVPTLVTTREKSHLPHIIKIYGDCCVLNPSAFAKVITQIPPHKLISRYRYSNHNAGFLFTMWTQHPGFAWQHASLIALDSSPVWILDWTGGTSQYFILWGLVRTSCQTVGKLWKRSSVELGYLSWPLL